MRAALDAQADGQPVGMGQIVIEHQHIGSGLVEHHAQILGIANRTDDREVRLRIDQPQQPEEHGGVVVEQRNVRHDSSVIVTPVPTMGR